MSSIIPHKPSVPDNGIRSPNPRGLAADNNSAVYHSSNKDASALVVIQTTDTTADGALVPAVENISPQPTNGSSAPSYAELLAAIRPQLLNLFREEVGERRKIREEEQIGFEDCRIVAAQMIAFIKKQRDEQYSFRSYTTAKPKSTSGALVVANAAGAHSEEVWFPASPPRGVPQKSRFPSKYAAKLLVEASDQISAEEAVVRDWIVGMEVKWRIPIERACVHGWMLLTSAERIEMEEEEHFQYLAALEDKMWKHLAKKEFKARPIEADREKARFISQLALGHVASMRSRAPDVPIETREVTLRDAITSDELAERTALFQWLHERYDVRLFFTIRLEDWERVDLFEEESIERFRMLFRSSQLLGYRQPLLGMMTCGCLERLVNIPTLAGIFRQ